MFRLLFLLVIVFAVNEKTYGYVQFIGKGYHACMTCHYNPFGNGPLNDYGRGVAATGLAGRFLIPDSIPDEELGERSSIIFGKPDKLPVKPSLDYRGLYIQSGLQQEEMPDPAWINMQAEMSLSAQFGTRQEYILTASYNTLIANSGVTANRNAPRNGKPEDADISYLREYYFGYRVNQELGVYLGKTDKVYGIRIPDHNLNSRNKTRNNQYSTVPGVVVHYGTEDYDAGFQVFVEDETEETNEKTVSEAGSGFAGKFEYTVTQNWRTGFSYLNETVKESEDKFDAMALINKLRIGEGSSMLLEMGVTNSTPDGGDTTTSQYIMLMNHTYLQRGLYFVTTYDQYTEDTSAYKELHNFGVGMQWFPLQRFEFRWDIFNGKNYSTSGGQKDTWSFLGQVHIWL